MNFKYKLVEDKHAGTKDWDKELLKKWDKEWDENHPKPSPDTQERIKNIAKEALSKKKCYECKTIKK